MIILSPINYSGNRCQKVDDILELIILSTQGKKINCFYELFSGSGPLCLSALEADIAQTYVLNDAYWAFNVFWKAIKEMPNELIHAYQKLLDRYCKYDTASYQQFYQQIQRNFNTIYLNQQSFSPEIIIKQAARFAFIINHANFGEPYFQDEYSELIEASYQKLNCQLTQEIGALEIDKQFSERVLTIHRLFKGKDIRFESNNFFQYLEEITENDIIILDPPYPNCPDHIETPDNYLYYRTDSKKSLKEKLQQFVNHCINKKLDFILFYEVLGVESQHSLMIDATHCLHIGTHPPYGFYAENLYLPRHYLEAVSHSETMICLDLSLQQAIIDINNNSQVSSLEKYKRIADLVHESINDKKFNVRYFNLIL